LISDELLTIVLKLIYILLLNLSFMFFVEAKAATNATSFIKLIVAAAAGYDCFLPVKFFVLRVLLSVFLLLKKFIL